MTSNALHVLEAPLHFLENNMLRITRALISVTDKAGIIPFAKGLERLGVTIISTGGTAQKLRDAKVAVSDIASVTGFPEVLDGRVKTLHPHIHAGILARRNESSDRRDLEAHGIEPIDLVVVNLYAFEETKTLEAIDIGGVTLLRAAAKNFEDVVVVADSADYGHLLDEMQLKGGSVSRETRFRLAKKAFALVTRYDAAISNDLSAREDTEAPRAWPETFAAVFEHVQPLRYGENPHQRAAFYRDAQSSSEPSLVRSAQLHGKELSYNNIVDADAALGIIKSFSPSPYVAAVVKHANPCGVAISAHSLCDAFTKARDADALSAFGGVVALGSEVDAETAEALGETFFEVILAPAYSEVALRLLRQKKNIRILEVKGLGAPFFPHGFSLRKITGGLLLQDRDISEELVRKCQVVTTRHPTEEEWKSLEFSWKVVKHVMSNAIVFANHDCTLGIGAGQMSRVDAVKLAVAKAQKQKNISTRVLASDAFFPFRDSVDEAARAGVTAIIQPGGSKRDDEVIAAANEHSIAMVATGIRHFRH